MKGRITSRKPIIIQVKKGQEYHWCSCGRSENQPYCDESHEGTRFTPVKYLALTDHEMYFCACKHTSCGPMCDGTHKSI